MQLHRIKPGQGPAFLLALFVAGCGGTTSGDAGSGAVDSGAVDSGAVLTDGGVTLDASLPMDSGSPDTGPADAGSPDSGSPDTGPDGSAGDAGGGALELLYQACDGTTFFPAGCPGEDCVEAGLERRVYDIWRARFMAIHGLSAAQMSARIEISDVSIAYGPTYVWWGVTYVFVMDWARSRQSESVNLGGFPLEPAPTDENITHGVNLAIETAEQFDLVGVVSIPAIETAFATCEAGMTLDVCSLDFVNVSGELTVRGRKALGGGTCAIARVDAATGSLLSCTTQPCLIM